MEQSRVKTELVYFVFPSCNGYCAHCWSSDRLLGRVKSLSWHENLIKKLCSVGHVFSEIKISGGEPFLHNDVGRFPELIHNYVNPIIPISIFTSGRPFVSWCKGDKGIEDTYSFLTRSITDFDNLSIQLSVDEYHIHSMSTFFGWKTSEKENNVYSFINNFITACEYIKDQHPLFMGPKLKIHCNNNRAMYHVEELFHWFPNKWWKHYVILTEGLIACGRGKSLQGSIKLRDDGPVSHFLLPGVDFYDMPLTSRAVRYKKCDAPSCVFLDDAPNSSVLIEGWWNLVYRIAKYERILIV